MFLVVLSYKKPIEEIERFLPDHVAYLDKYYECKKFIFSGRRNPRVGGIILMNSDSGDEVNHMIQEDPFHQEGLAEYEVIEFTPTKYDMRFKEFIV